MDGVVEIITGREGRRRWSTADKLRIVAETQEPGAAIRAVAARHDVCESLLFTWRRQVREGVLTASPDISMFMPVRRQPRPRPAAALGNGQGPGRCRMLRSHAMYGPASTSYRACASPDRPSSKRCLRTLGCLRVGACRSARSGRWS